MYDYRPAAGGGSGKLVLLVSSRRAVREALTQGLRAAGFEVEAVSSGVGGLLSLREASPGFDWLITELAMPGAIDGRNIAYEYRFQRPLRPALFIGSETGDAYAPEGEIIPFPPDARQIAAMIAELAGSLRDEQARVLEET